MSPLTCAVELCANSSDLMDILPIVRIVNPCARKSEYSACAAIQPVYAADRRRIQRGVMAASSAWVLGEQQIALADRGMANGRQIGARRQRLRRHGNLHPALLARCLRWLTRGMIVGPIIWKYLLWHGGLSSSKSNCRTWSASSPSC